MVIRCVFWYSFDVAIDRSRERAAMTARLWELMPRLNERDRRLALGAEAESWGRGGIAEVHRATGMSRTTIGRGIEELSASENSSDTVRVRAAGGVVRKPKMPTGSWCRRWMR